MCGTKGYDSISMCRTRGYDNITMYYEKNGYLLEWSCLGYYILMYG